MTSPVSQTNTKFILETIEKLRSCCQVNIQSDWRWLSDDLAVADVTGSYSALSEVQLNAKGQVAWAGGQKVLWLVQKLVIPEDLQGYTLQGLSLRLALIWWADSAQIYVNGELVGEGDLFDCSPRVLLSPGVTPGLELIVALRLVSPGHCDGALMRSLLVYESIGENRADPGFLADELAVMQHYLEAFAPENLGILAAAVEGINWNRLLCETLRERAASPLGEDAKDAKEEKGFEQSLFALRRKLLESHNHLCPSGLGCGFSSKIYLLGHAHLDLAWLWPLSETWRAAQSTFESVLKLLQEFPELIFCHSTPALYAWIEEHRPDLFDAIQQAHRSGRWEVVGGLWVEPELNLIAGESIVRQLLYGQRYVLEKFGKVSTVEWLPDSFGFCATLPQFLKNAGIEYFVTQKLRWNDTTKFDYGAFWWRSPDGSEVFSLMSALIGEGIDPIKMASYACEWQTQTGLSAALWLPGVGDHGGGPTRDMLEIAQRFSKSPFFPELEFTTAEKYLQQIQSTTNNQPLTTNNQHPIWSDELYLEFHRGCYTTHGDQKRWNRRCEGLLYQAELFAALAHIGCDVIYPQAELEAAWKKVLFNQFHDILPGSSITQVYVDALTNWQFVETVGTDILQRSLTAISSQISLPDPPHPNSLPVVVFNSLNWQRSEVAAVPLPELAAVNQEWQIYDVSGQKLLSQVNEASTLLFLASDIPPVGYRVFWLASHTSNQQPTTNNQQSTTNNQQLTTNNQQPTTNNQQPNWIIENEFLKVVVDGETGDLSSVFDKIHLQEVLSSAGNQLQAFQDSGQYWDAWNIDPNYAQHPLPPTLLKSIQWLELGPVQSRVRVVRQLGRSEFCQDYILQVRSPILKIATTVNWQERQVLVKVAFPLNVDADEATYEIPCGAIRRPTKPKTPAEQAKWEVPALRWADLTQDMGHGASDFSDNSQCPIPHAQCPNQYGVSLLNDCKYGYDSQHNQLRLTLLRSPNWPDPQADLGFHEFQYALYPHAGSWQSAQTVRRGYEFNLPLQVICVNSQGKDSNKSLPPVARLLDLSAENLILMAFKQAEDSQQWILRCYECHGETAELHLVSDLGLNLGDSVDLLERSSATSPTSAASENLTIKPWKIASFQVRRSTPGIGQANS